MTLNFRSISSATVLMAMATPFIAQTSTRTQSMDTENNKTVVRRLHEEAMNGGRLDLIDELIVPEFPNVRGGTGPAAFRRTIEELRTGFPDIHYTLEHVLAEGDRVVVRWTWRGTHTGQFRTYAATGAQVSNTGTAIYEVRNGKVVNVWLETDRLGFLEQIGVISPPLSTGAATPVSGVAAPPRR